MFFILPILALLGAAVSGVSQAMRAKAEADAAEANAKELARAAGFEDANAADALRQGALVAGAQRMRAGQMIGQQRTAAAASGIDAQSASIQQMQAGTGFYGELDAQTEMNNAWRRAMGHKEQARRYRSGSDQQVKAAGDARTAGAIAATSTMLGGAVDAFSTYKSYGGSKS